MALSFHYSRIEDCVDKKKIGGEVIMVDWIQKDMDYRFVVEAN